MNKILMRLEATDEDDLEAWKANGMTVLLKDVIERVFKVQKDIALQRYWEGDPMPEADQLALRRLMSVFEDFFESSLDDLMISMEMFDEQNWNKTSGVQRAGAAAGRPN